MSENTTPTPPVTDSAKATATQTVTAPKFTQSVTILGRTYKCRTITTTLKWLRRHSKKHGDLGVAAQVFVAGIGWLTAHHDLGMEPKPGRVVRNRVRIVEKLKPPKAEGEETKPEDEKPEYHVRASLARGASLPPEERRNLQNFRIKVKFTEEPDPRKPETKRWMAWWKGYAIFPHPDWEAKFGAPFPKDQEIEVTLQEGLNFCFAEQPPADAAASTASILKKGLTATDALEENVPVTLDQGGKLVVEYQHFSQVLGLPKRSLYTYDEVDKAADAVSQPLKDLLEGDTSRFGDCAAMLLAATKAKLACVEDARRKGKGYVHRANKALAEAKRLPPQRCEYATSDENRQCWFDTENGELCRGHQALYDDPATAEDEEKAEQEARVIVEESWCWYQRLHPEAKEVKADLAQAAKDVIEESGVVVPAI